MTNASAENAMHGLGLTESEFRDAMVTAVRSGDISSVRSLFSHHPLPEWLNTIEKLKETTCNAIYKSVVANDIERVRELFLGWNEDSSLPSFVPHELEQSLSVAVKAGSKQIVMLLLQNGARMTGVVGQAIFAPLTYDAETFTSILNDLLEYGWDNIDYDDILRRAVDRRPLLEWALLKGANPNTEDSSGRSAMSHAAMRGTLSTIEFLFEHGAKVNDKDVVYTARRQRPDSENIAILEFFLCHGASNLNVKARVPMQSSSALAMSRGRFSTALYQAASADDLEMVEWLIKHGADATMQDLVGGRRGPSSIDRMLKSKNAALKQIAEDSMSELNATKAVSGGSEA